MICVVCRQAEITDGFTDVMFERGETRLVISHVPAHVCPICREAYVDQDVAAQLLQHAEEMSEAGVLDATYESSTV